MHVSRSRTARWRALPLLLSASALAVAAFTLPQPSEAETAGQSHSAAERYLGRWNYDMPDYGTMTNIAVSDAPGRAEVPQVGDIVFTAEGADRVVGRTDVGCTWRFEATRASLELDPPGQLCHNPTSNVSYTVEEWTVTVTGRHARETIAAVSHRPGGEDFTFALDNGARTRAKEYDPRSADAFTGTWEYDPSDEASGLNMRTTFRTGPDGTPTVAVTPQQGHVVITGEYGDRITADTGDGCSWSLATRGGTAKLDPPIQTCTLSDSAAITMRSWTIAVDGDRQAAVMTGTDGNGDDFALSIGGLGRD